MENIKITRNKKWYAFSILIFLVIWSGIYFWGNISQNENRMIDSSLLTKEKRYFVPLKIQGFSTGNIPYLDVTIENQRVPAQIDLGYSGMVSLSSDIIKEVIKKKFIQRSRMYGFRGKTYENDLYEVEQLNTENMSFFPVKIEEKNQEHERDICLVPGKDGPSINKGGSIGWHLFYNFNLLVDCKHSMFALCDSLETLKQREYPVDFFTETPLLLDRDLIEFEALTEAGPLRCMLDTGCTLNMLNKDLETGCNDHMIFTGKDGDQSFLNPDNKDLLIFDIKDTQELTSFKIGEKEFGPLTFNRFKSPMAVDAIIGMEFIDSTLIFIDFTNCKIYFFAYPPEEKTSTISFIVKADSLLFLGLLSSHSRLPLCRMPFPSSTCFYSLLRSPAYAFPVKILDSV